MSEVQHMLDLPVLSPETFLNLFFPEFLTKKPKEMRPVMIWGQPGIGKSDIVKELAAKLQEKTNKVVLIHDVRLSLYTPIDLIGIPCPDEHKEYTVYLRPEMFKMDDSPNVINILFFDEITNATPSTAASCYQIILDRKIATHQLPDNCYVLCAGNRTIDRSGVYKMLKPLANRMSHVELVTSLNDWKKWAYRQKDFDSRVIAFLNYRPNLLCVYDPSSDYVAFPTPRSWESVARRSYNRNIFEIVNLIASDIGTSAANEFLSFSRLYDQLPVLKDIENGKYSTIPSEPDVMYALCGAIVNRISDIDKQDIQKVENLLEYLMKFPVEYQFIAMSDIRRNAKAFLKAALCQNFILWSNHNKQYLED